MGHSACSADERKWPTGRCVLYVCVSRAHCQVVRPVCILLSPSPPSRSPAMGNLIKVLGKDLENCPHFFLDFESK